MFLCQLPVREPFQEGLLVPKEIDADVGGGVGASDDKGHGIEVVGFFLPLLRF